MCGGIVLAVLAAFGGSLFLGFAPIDDLHLIVQNPAVRIFSWPSILYVFTHFDPELYIPITFLSFMTESAVGGAHPWLYHADNLLLHTANALLVALLLLKLTGSKTASVCAACVFAVHPIQTEAVVWISARKDLLATFFALLTTLTALRAAESSRNYLWILSTIFFLLGVLSKVSIAFLPILLFFLLARKKSPRQLLLPLSPHAAIAIIASVIAIIGKSTVISSDVTLFDRSVLAGYAMTSGLTRFFLPIHLGPFYPLPPVNAATICLALVIAGVMAFAIVLRKRAPLFCLGVLWFFLTVLPTVLNIQTDIRSAGATFAADRYLYLPSIGILLAIVGITPLLRRFPETTVRSFGITIGAVIILICLPVSHMQTGMWRDAETLFSHVLSYAPSDIHARLGLVRTLKNEGRLSEAFDVLTRGLSFSDDPRLHLEAGFLYAQAGDTDSSEEQFLLVRTTYPDIPDALFGLAGLRSYEKKFDEAIDLYQESIALEPKYIQARIELAVLLADEKKDMNAAGEQLRVALEIEPGDLDALLTLSALLHMEGKTDEAEVLSKRAALLQGGM